jgi:hypothetical protein
MRETYDLRELTGEMAKAFPEIEALSICLVREGTELAAYDRMWTFLWN